MKDIDKVTDWETYLKEGQKNSVESILDFGKRVYEFKQSCETKQGGTDFASKCKDWLGMSQAVASKWVAIGINNGKLILNKNKLPDSMQPIYLSTTLEPEQFQQGIDNGDINPKATQKAITMFKKSFVPTQPAKAEGWQKLIKGVWETEAKRDSKWFIAHARPLVEENYGDFGNWIAHDDQDSFIGACEVAYARYCAENDIVEIDDAEVELSETSKDKLERAERVMRKRLLRENENIIWERVSSEVDKIAPRRVQEYCDVIERLDNQTNIFTATEYKKILSALHPDRAVDNEVLRKKLEISFNLFKKKETELKGMSKSDETKAKKYREDMLARIAKRNAG